MKDYYNKAELKKVRRYPDTAYVQLGRFDALMWVLENRKEEKYLYSKNKIINRT